MSFSTFKKHFQANFADMVKDADTLFKISIDKDEFWNLYLDSFPAGTNPIFRERREYDCSCCRHFIKAIGNVALSSVSRSAVSRSSSLTSRTRNWKASPSKNCRLCWQVWMSK